MKLMGNKNSKKEIIDIIFWALNIFGLIIAIVFATIISYANTDHSGGWAFLWFIIIFVPTLITNTILYIFLSNQNRIANGIESQEFYSKKTYEMNMARNEILASLKVEKVDKKFNDENIIFKEQNEILNETNKII